MAPTDADVLATVERSLVAASARDRAGWLQLFTADGRVEDPVGSRPHVGAAQIARFYDTFIGPRRITAHRDADFVSGSTVVRDLTLGVRMNAGVTMAVPAVLRYTVRDTDHGLAIAELRAYWELPAMMLQFARRGRAAVPAGLAMTWALLVNRHVNGTVGFLRGLRPPARRERAVLLDLLTALTAGDELATRRVLGPAAAVTVGRDVLAARMRGATWTKVICAGHAVTASLSTRDGRAVLLADFTEQATIERLQFFG